MSRTLIYGGSFNPPHLGHVDALRAAREALRPERILIIPGHVPPHKELAADSPAAQARLHLTRLAFAAFDEAEVSDMELCRGGVSYTVETLEELSRHGDEELVFLMGTDMFLTMEKWFRYERIMELAALAVLPRNDGENADITAYAAYLEERYKARVYQVPKAPLPMDSTGLRTALKERRGREKLPEVVYGEIIRCRYYGARPELAWLREQSYRRHKPKRIPHVAGCEEMAVQLAGRWGEDAEKAAEAAILHDISKKFGPEEQLYLCDEYGIIADAVEREETQLLHAKTGAAMARALFGVEDDIYGAIFWHTTGRADMTRLEKIVYLSDAMEKTRQYDGVETLRRLAFEDLDAAMISALEMSLALIRSRGKTPHRQTEEALQWFLAKRNDTL